MDEINKNLKKNEKVYIFDTTMRDGEQVPGCQLNTAEKIKISKALEKMGVDIIEAGFPISSPGDFNSVMEISKVVKNSVICALTRAKKEDIDCAAEALRFAKHKRIHTGIGSSDIHIMYKFNSTREKVLKQGVEAVKYAKKLVEEVEFYAEDAGRADNYFLSQMVEAVIESGADVINIPDTTGYCMPEEFGNKIRFLYEHVKNIHKVVVSVHCHNDLGLATANSIAGIRNGARQIECTINGIGERAGNTSLEEIVMIMKCKKNTGLYTEIDTTKLTALSWMVSELMNMPVQANKAIVGKNAFAHSSGIHQDGFLKNQQNYEIINPEEVGAKCSSIVLTARSGRAALNYKLERLGYTFTKEELDELYKRYIILADKIKKIYPSNIHSLVRDFRK